MLTQYSIVEYVPGSGVQNLALLQANKGLSREAIVQLAAELAVFRHYCAFAPLELLTYGSDGQFYRRFDLPEVERLQNDVLSQLSSVNVVGAEPLRDDPVPSGITEGWGMLLCLAIDGVLEGIRKSPDTSAPDGEFRGAVLPLAPVLVAVAGVAGAVVASVTAWRYFDPQLRADTATVAAAAGAYSARLGAWRETGTMPDPSPLETAAKNVVTRVAEERTSRAVLFGGGVLGGGAIGLIALAALRSSMGRDAQA